MTVLYRPLRLEDATEAQQLEAVCFPHLAADMRLRADDAMAHVRIFPEGAFAAEQDGRLVGFAIGWLMDFDFEHPQHRLVEVSEPEMHDPDGDWYYGLSISVHPEARGRGIGGEFYRRRKEMVRRLNRRGMVAGGMIPGYQEVEDDLTAEEYIADVVAGRRHDPTLTFQLESGFAVRGLLPGYVDGTAGGGIATLLVWENEDYPQP